MVALGEFGRVAGVRDHLVPSRGGPLEDEAAGGARGAENWDTLTHDVVALLRADAGRNPYDRALSDLIGELSTRSDVFRTLWATHNVRLHSSGVKHLHHPVVGDLTLAYESMELTADTGLRINAYTAEPGSPSQDVLALLASWTASQQEQPAD